MAHRVAVSRLNASTVDILNVIRQNASMEYQALVPEITQTQDIPRVGEAIFGNPGLANQFIFALMNRIAAVRMKSMNFNNRFAALKKGYLDFGEVVEEVFVSMAKAREFSEEKAESREFKRTLPDVRSAFHVINWQVQYPLTIEQQRLRQAFLTPDGITDFIAKLIQSVYTAADYDEFLLFKYLMIKGIAHGEMYPVSVDTSDIKNAAVAFRGTSNLLEFPKKTYNRAGVTTATEKADQYIFMDASFNAQYDVNVLAAAFNMDKADFMGRLILVDDWTSFDNERFDVIRANSTQIEEVSAAELSLMNGVVAVLADQEYFQVYDNLFEMSDTKVSSGLYWNYFLNVWKTVSTSPFSNAVVFASSVTNIVPNTFTANVASVSVSDEATIFTLEVEPATGFESMAINFIQNQAATAAGVAVVRAGAYIFRGGEDINLVPVAQIGNTLYNGTAITDSVVAGDTITFTKQA